LLRYYLSFCFVAVLFAAGCAQPTIALYDPAAKPPTQAPTVYNDDAWAATLRENVRDGLVDYRHLVEHPEPLNTYIDYIGFVGPDSTPSFFKEQEARLCYYLNAFNACVLKAVLAENIPPTVHDVHRPPFEHTFVFRVDGQRVTLADLRARARANSNGNARIEFAMCAAAMGSPPLSGEAFRPYNVVEHLKRLARQAMDNADMVRIDHEKQQILVALAIWSQREAFKQLYMRETGSDSATMLNCLMHLASAPRREYFARATGYDVVLLPFDRALNIYRPTAVQ
jgi:hypothetical protein